MLRKTERDSSGHLRHSSGLCQAAAEDVIADQNWHPVVKQEILISNSLDCNIESLPHLVVVFADTVDMDGCCGPLVS